MPVSTVTSRLWPRRVVELDSEARVGKDPQQCQWLSSAGCKSLHAAITTLGNGFCLEIANVLLDSRQRLLGGPTRSRPSR